MTSAAERCSASRAAGNLPRPPALTRAGARLTRAAGLAPLAALTLTRRGSTLAGLVTHTRRRPLRALARLALSLLALALTLALSLLALALTLALSLLALALALALSLLALALNLALLALTLTLTRLTLTLIRLALTLARALAISRPLAVRIRRMRSPVLRLGLLILLGGGPIRAMSPGPRRRAVGRDLRNLVLERRISRVLRLHRVDLLGLARRFLQFLPLLGLGLGVLLGLLLLVGRVLVGLGVLGFLAVRLANGFAVRRS